MHTAYWYFVRTTKCAQDQHQIAQMIWAKLHPFCSRSAGQRYMPQTLLHNLQLASHIIICNSLPVSHAQAEVA